MKKGFKRIEWLAEKYELLRQGLCRCVKCKNIKELNQQNFSIRKDVITGFSAWCRDCQRNHAKVKQREKRLNPVTYSIVKMHKIKHAQSPKGREGKRKSSAIRNHKKRSKVFRWTIKDWEICKKFFKMKCAYCHQIKELTQDHFIPLSDENCPGTLPENMVPACNSCNCSKNNNNPEQWCSKKSKTLIIKYFNFLKQNIH